MIEATTTAVTSTVKAGAKRPRESDAAEEGAELSKAERKKLNKKQKALNGDAVPTGTADKPASKTAPNAAAADGAEKKKKKEKKDKTAAEGAATNGAPGSSKQKTQTLPSGLVIDDGKVGEGKEAKKGSTVSVRYIGKLTNGTTFDSNTKGKPVSCPIRVAMRLLTYCFAVHVQGWAG